MILSKYIFKELFKSQAIVLLVLIAIFVGQSVVRLITDVATGNIPAQLIFSLLLYSLPKILVYLIPLTLYISIILSLGRICSDSEMVVMRMTGFSPVKITLITLLLALISAILVGYISIHLTTQAANAQYKLEVQASNNPEFLPIESGRFVSFGAYNIYIEEVGRDNDNKNISNIYVIESSSTSTNGVQSITIAKQGHIVIDEDGVKWLVLDNGERYDFSQEDTYQIASFSSSKSPIAGNITEETKQSTSIERKSFIELLQSNNIREQVEAQWRISPIFAIIILSIVAVPLSMINPRQGRFARLGPAILIYVAYYMILLSLRNFIITGTIPLYPGLYIVPLAFIFLVVIPLNMPKAQLKKNIFKRNNK